mmetsp:Transcript_22450/g.27067  ORF Transcript_22450/g.27067 Transcript_22450/m.27067 type:complete len:101 (-) Transcript_22450:219-521(-)|eukprot:CAMPEP_0195319844 /NCGR_PEP_ID=MMETSP0708-20121125/5747_1 /TAXON_ID=33640 /ORGANISM="Asterionellopsis glacialis, Strain CCMP134" /LENGTH=100 /DNA_ID=CAMNT_0040386135 /DNA_START=82 /DNA_END=384 /DNA_ORIENTATION=-
MAFSLLNHFFWDIEDARLPFIFADVVVVTSLHYVEKGMKAEKEMQKTKAALAGKAHEEDKLSNRALKSATRDEQKRLSGQTKHMASSTKPHPINQPKKQA